MAKKKAVRKKKVVAAKKKKVAPKKKAAPAGNFDEIRKVVKKAKPFQIVRGKGYLYFCIQPSQEEIVFQHVLTRPLLGVTSVYNYKDSVIGYLVECRKKPHAVQAQESGAAIFFTDKTEHAKPTILFSDHKLRVLSFSGKDFYVSVKWKSNLATDD